MIKLVTRDKNGEEKELNTDEHLSEIKNIIKRKYAEFYGEEESNVLDIGPDIFGILFPKSRSEDLYFENSSIAEERGLVEDPFSGNLIRKDSLSRKISNSETKPRCKFVYDTIVSKTNNKKTAYKKGIDSPTFIGTGEMNYKFGIEIETERGLVPHYKYIEENLNMYCEKDGSLREEDGVVRGGEYVTAPLQGDMGLLQLHNICRVLSKRCKVDRRCAMHIHIGYTYFTKAFSVFSYILGYKVQDSMFSILPPSRRDNPFCSPLKRFMANNLQGFINDYGYKYGVQAAHTYLFKNLSNGKMPDKKINRYSNHPEGRYCGRYQREEGMDVMRYDWLNLVPCNFNMKGGDIERAINNDSPDPSFPFTVEFRPHSGTTSYRKIKNYLLICMSFVNFVEHHREEILNEDSFSIEYIVSKVLGGKQKQRVLEYIKNRKEKFKEKNIDEGDLVEINSEEDHDKKKAKELIIE